MMTFIDMYTSSVLDHPNTICTPYSFIVWRIVIPILLVLWFLMAFYVIQCCLGTRALPIHCPRWYFYVVFYIYLISFLGLQLWAPLSSIEGLIIKEKDKDKDIMFQLLFNYGENLTVWSSTYPKVYTIFFRLDDIGKMLPNSTCDFVPFSELCPVFGPLRSTNFSGAFRCQPNSGYGLKPFVLYSESLSGSGRTAMNLGIAFTFLFLHGWCCSMYRRLSSLDQWIENQHDEFSHVGLDEDTGLI